MPRESSSGLGGLLCAESDELLSCAEIWLPGSASFCAAPIGLLCRGDNLRRRRDKKDDEGEEG